MYPSNSYVQSTFLVLLVLLSTSLPNLVKAAAVTSTISPASLPKCQGVAPQQNNLTDVKTTSIALPGRPFGLVYASSHSHPHPKHKDIAFVSILENSTSSLGVLNTSSFAPVLIHQITLPKAYVGEEGGLGLAITNSGQHVLVAAGEGVVVVDVDRAIAGRKDAVVGALNGTVGTQRSGNAAIEVTLSKDDKFAFVSQEYGANLTQGNVDVFKLSLSKDNGTVTTQGAAVGYLGLGRAVVGTALSPNGKRLYAVSELSLHGNATSGQLSVIDVPKLKKDPSQALISNVDAGCQPVRIIVSSDGRVVWVTARASNHLLAFDAKKLVSNPGNALLASVQVGTNPVGLIFARNETRILTTDSNRFENSNATTGLSVIDVKAALKGSNKAVLGSIPTGLFPREFAISPDGRTILVSDFSSGQIQAVDVDTLP